MHLSAGSLVGSYRILAPLGAGGMGEVYRARDEKLNRDVALKVLLAELASSTDHLRRFQLEAHAASALNHPNIITIYDIGRFDETAYISMELVDGQDLRTMQAGERMPLKSILRVAVKVADGLAAAHERGIVHRDLKPENVMISRDGFVKILDFGLAKLVKPITETEVTAPHTTPGAVFGTVAYMSPEQAAGRNVDFRSDQFSLGVILYEMLSGRMPFNEATAAETLAAIIRRDVPAIPAVNDVPPELQRVLDRCLAKDPVDRYASTRDLARDLREIRDRISNTSEPRYRSDRPPVRSTRRVAWIGGAVAAIAVITAGITMALRRGSEKTEDQAQHGPLSLAVLPFKDLSGSPDGQIFTDGIAEMIRSRLGESRTIRIIPAFDRDATGDPPSIARRLGAAFAVTGAVQRTGNDLHLSVSVIDAKSGVQVAGETLNGTTNDIFGLHNRAVGLILGGVKVRQDASRKTASSELSRPEDQSAYIEALGLLQRARDEQSVDRAIRTLEKLLLNARDSALVNAQLARALLYKSQMGRRPGLIEQATVYAERAAELDDTQPEIHVRLGQLRNAAGRYGDAELEYRRSLSLQPENVDAIVGLAETNEAMGRAADAEALYRKAIELRPRHPGGYQRYAVFLYNSGRYEEAAKNFERVAELAPSALTYSNVGSTYQALGRYDDARRALEKSIELAPTSDAYVNLGSIQYHSGRFAEASRAAERATTLSPTSYWAWLVLGDSYRHSPGMQGQSADAFEKAVRTAREAVAVNPRDAEAQAVAVNALAKIGRLSEAADASKTALKLDPNNQQVLYSAAVVALLRGNADVAVSWLQRAAGAGYSVTDLQRDPDFKTIQNDPAFPRVAVVRKQ